MPVATVIPAPLVYTNVAAVKKLVVGVGASRHVIAWGSLATCHLCCTVVGARLVGGIPHPCSREWALPYPQVGSQLRVPLNGWPAAPIHFTLKN